MSSRMDLIDLARHLRQESLFVSSEKQNLQHLNEKVTKAAERLYHLTWIARQQRLTLDSLLLSHADSHLAACCQRANTAETAHFVDSYKQLGIHDGAYSEFLKQLRENPKLLAACLSVGEKIDLGAMHSIVDVVMAALYGNCVLPEDEIHVLHLLKELMSLQLAGDNPRRLLRHGSCAFSRVYKAFSEGLFSAKIFLTAALQEPLLHLLMHDDLFLDIDPGKAAVRFHPPERLRHFGREGTPEYDAKLQEYRQWTIRQLAGFTHRFIEQIRQNVHCFPPGLAWLTRQLYATVTQGGGRVEGREAGAMCADLVFAFFLCPAIVDPEAFGITDIPVSYIARFNLMQVAQILQVLAMSKWEDIDPKLMDLYGNFEKDCMSSFLDLILEGSTSESPVDLVNQFQDLNRSAVLITESELSSLVSFLRSVETETQESALKKTLKTMMNHLPPPNSNNLTSLQNGSGHSTLCNMNSVENLHHSTPSSKKSFLGKVGRKTSKLPVDVENQQCEVDTVLVVPVAGADSECPGMLNEEKVLAIESQKHAHSLENGSLLGGDTLNIGPEIVEKRTRFSLSQDQESVGTSDNLEAISEAASNHSVASSLDLENENENDNLSDMVSANVSGRGTPNVSGRDTPSSQLEGGEEQRRPPLDLMTAKQSQDQDIQDKFGKFEIQPMIEGDETKSMVSDTWSTDVLASDSETVEQSDMASQGNLESQRCLELLGEGCETASQSDTWSTDVLASDTERLQELDTDDTGSVARSDDTASDIAGHNLDATKDLLLFDDPFLPGDYVAQRLLRPGRPPPSEGEDSTTACGGPKTSSMSSEAEPFKVPDLLCNFMDTNFDVPPLLKVPSSRNESLSSMQSLGRVSLAIRELPDADDPTHGPMLLDSLQETVQQGSNESHRSSIVDILSLDLTRTLHLPSPEHPAPSLQNSEIGGSLMDFEQELLLQGGGERGAKRKLGSMDDVCPQLRAVSFTTDQQQGQVSSEQRQLKANSAPVGAIPKAVIFNRDTVAMDQEMDEKIVGDKNRKSLFKISGFRFTFKNRTRKSHSSLRPFSDKDDAERSGNRFSQSSMEERALQIEAGDEILAKYRKKPAGSVGSGGKGHCGSDVSDVSSSISDGEANSLLDAKRKLRLVLGSADLHTLPWAPHSSPHVTTNEMVAFLKVLLAESVSLQQRPLMVHVHEALRCISLCDPQQCQNLLQSLRDDYRRRAPYIAYLVRCRQGLLSTLCHLEMLIERIERDKQVCNQYLIMMCVKIFLEKRDRHLQHFVCKFQELVVPDEKANLVEKFLNLLFNYMDTDPLWQSASEAQAEAGRAVVEHSVMSRIYTSALHPNGDVDVLRDKILHEHMQKLSQVVTPNHEALRISKVYHSECPWPSAQAELFSINAYKTPRDKIQCVLRTCATIMSLLGMAEGGGVPAADDLIPVLVFVTIRANPPHLLSTVQYVNTFYEKQLEGEEAYWWTQFASCVEFIKNMG